MSTFVEHVHCMRCGKRCSGVDPDLGLVVRAFVECPECIEADTGGWQPIETAPKDGRALLVCQHQYQPFVARWQPLPFGGGYFRGQGEADGVHPTHWMPLPEPPQ